MESLEAHIVWMNLGYEPPCFLLLLTFANAMILPVLGGLWESDSMLGRWLGQGQEFHTMRSGRRQSFINSGLELL
ncbi:hypothetical protein H0H93_005302, partial [Arthromyces matolae]